jgi:alpha-tubulin suppressor-like RCC1 family protein
MGLKANGECWSWGDNAFGQLGNNTVTSYSSPIAVVGSHSFIRISAGTDTAAALKSDGSMWCWGSNSVGQCGNNAAALSYSSPVQVVGSHSFIMMSSGFNNVMALKANGTVWCWGNNASGQLGDNSRTNRSSPVAVVGSHSFINISYGASLEVNSTTAALKSDGSAWCWGNNTRGQIGNNTVTSYSSPVAVVGGHVFTLLTSGSGFVMGFKPDGSVWGWGVNAGGRLGVNTATGSYSSPVAMVGSHSFITLWDKRLHRVSVDDGSAWHRAAYAWLDTGAAWQRIVDVRVLV